MRNEATHISYASLRFALSTADGLQTACSRPDGLRYERLSIRMGWGGSEFFLAESQSRLYPHMRAKCVRDPTAVSKKMPFNFISRLYCNLKL